MILEFLKRNSIVLLFSLICLVMLVMILLELDRQYYQNTKRGIILENLESYMGESAGKEERENLAHLAVTYLDFTSAKTADDLQAEISKILNGPNTVWRIVIKDMKGGGRAAGAGDDAQDEFASLDVARYDKLHSLNNFTNSLFLRNFSSGMTFSLDDNDPQGKKRGRLILYWTTPRNNPEIAELTTLYRWYSLFIIIATGVIAFTIARRLLFPIRNISSAIEGSTPERTLFIGQPHTRMETLYNRMALDAVIARLQDRMREEIARAPQMTGWEVVRLICRAFSEQLGLTLAACLEMVSEGPGHIRATGQVLFFSQGPLEDSREEILGQIDRLLPRDGRGEAAFACQESEPPLEGVMQLLPDPERGGIRYLFALGQDARLPADNASLPLKHMLGRLLDLVETGLETLSLRNQILVQERGRANISLSRNLGHDLTNIIATSKLELMALERLLGDGRAPDDARRRTILLESLHGLLRSVRFMQETVNLYRSYAFLQHPRLEMHDGNELVSATLELFEMSTSANIDFRRELAPDAPRCVVDPRLVKLALFNLFTNALEAIRKADPDRSAHGWIRVVTGRTGEGGLSISVEDSGTGIMNADGERAESHEIEMIFELGYTSKRLGGGQGEGLGLNWVRTIVQDLHGGTIVAENSPAGGARFILNLPPVEAAPPAPSLIPLAPHPENGSAHGD